MEAVWLQNLRGKPLCYSASATICGEDLNCAKLSVTLTLSPGCVSEPHVKLYMAVIWQLMFVQQLLGASGLSTRTPHMLGGSREC